MIEVLTISSGTPACGIYEYANHLQAHLPGDLIMRGNGRGEWLDPEVFFAELPSIQEYEGPQVVWLNYHAALHSRWTPLRVHALRQRGLPVVITYHDTSVPNGDQCLRMYQETAKYTADRLGAASFIIHEPCDDLPGAIYLRQGVPNWQPHSVNPLAKGRPLLGSVGFPFPWKNYQLLAEATAEAGWSLFLMASGATKAQIQTWQSINPWTTVIEWFTSAEEVVSCLAACDATAFLYSCANTGTSGAIRQGIAARKPVIATRGCRQFRDLEEDPLGAYSIRWVADLTPTGIANQLTHLHLGRLDPRVQRLAERDSWHNQAAKYAEIFRSCAGVAPSAP